MQFFHLPKGNIYIIYNYIKPKKKPIKIIHLYESIISNKRITYRTISTSVAFTFSFIEIQKPAAKTISTTS